MKVGDVYENNAGNNALLNLNANAKNSLSKSYPKMEHSQNIHT